MPSSVARSVRSEPTTPVMPHIPRWPAATAAACSHRAAALGRHDLYRGSTPRARHRPLVSRAVGRVRMARRADPYARWARAFGRSLFFERLTNQVGHRGATFGRHRSQALEEVLG